MRKQDQLKFYKAELAELDALIAELPEEFVIDRISLERRRDDASRQLELFLRRPKGHLRRQRSTSMGSLYLARKLLRLALHRRRCWIINTLYRWFQRA